MPCFSAGSVTTTKCQDWRFDAVGACSAISRHSSIRAGSTGRSKSSRLRTERVVVRSSSGVSMVGEVSGTAGRVAPVHPARMTHWRVRAVTIAGRGPPVRVPEEARPVPLKHPKGPSGPSHHLTPPPLFTTVADRIPRHELPEGELPPDVAYQVVHDELMLDGNARLNLATFVSTWGEPQARQLIADCLDKNMIDKDEYPQTAEHEMRCVNMMSRLWHEPEADEATGC